MKTKNLIILVVVIILLLALLFIVKNVPVRAPVGPDGETQTIGNTDEPDYQPVPLEVSGNKDDLVFSSIKPGDSIGGEVILLATVQGAYFFEGNIGITIEDTAGNILKQTHGMAITEWMTIGPVTFTSALDLIGIAPGPGYIVIRADNASGLPEHDKSIKIPVVFQ
ncbi:hypothetical protein IPF86_00615 [Candidatus Nomurabacteria bacterium]|jgi:ABC-type cobalt transport system substrate-binding protein|nr:MAG: hypothetical protein IPF86_00615 [Candidatus Nomurabacteria bacterium]